MVINRGEIWWAELPLPSGPETGYRHPVVVVQSNEFNRSLINTVVAVVITTNMRLSQAPGNILLPKRISRLPKDSVINVSQVVTLDKNVLTHKVSRLPDDFLHEVEDDLRFVLSM
jgi:mRNA interferase MazF